MEVNRMTFSDPYRTIIVEPGPVPAPPVESPEEPALPEPEPAAEPEREPAGGEAPCR
jgi:hypothetical protein